MRISARDYLAAVLPGLADHPIRCLPDLTPVAWVASIPRVCGRADELGGRGMQVDGLAADESGGVSAER